MTWFLGSGAWGWGDEGLVVSEGAQRLVELLVLRDMLLPATAFTRPTARLFFARSSSPGPLFTGCDCTCGLCCDTVAAMNVCMFYNGQICLRSLCLCVRI